ncbi:MAG: tetratricopeptide repeat protein [Desulfobulbus sp.]|nr:tetratricopeptide repeat protein [Desulfobulbus sp.]
MSGLSFRSCCRSLVTLWCLTALLSGCADTAKAPDTSVSANRPPAPASGDVDRSCSSFYFLWGRHSELLLQFEEALEFYQKALICDEQADYISEKIPILLLRLERTSEASSWLADYLQGHPDKTGMRMLYAKVLLRQKKTTEAMHQYQLISERHPDDAAILLLLSEMYINAEQPERAEPLLSRILVREPNSYLGHILMARMRQAEGKTDDAVDHYQRALKRNWSSDLNMELGEVLVKSGRYDEAVKLYRELVEKDGGNESARVALVHVYLLQKKDSQALAELNRLKTIAEQPQRVDLTIARLYAKQKHYDKAIAIVEKLLTRENLPEARYFLAVLQVQQGRLGKALKQVRLIEPTAPEYADAFFLQVRILREQDKLDQALELLEHQISSGPLRNSELYIMLAGLHQLEGRDDLSKKVLLQGIDAFPNDGDLLYEYGLLLEGDGDHEAALAIMEKIIDLKPDHAAALNFVGYSWADTQVNLDQALEYIRRAIEIKPENGYIHDSLGWVYYRLGKLDQATKELETAVKLSPDDAAILDHLGDVYLESGRVRDALRTYKKALKLSKEDEQEKKRILEKIRILEKQGGR